MEIYPYWSIKMVMIGGLLLLRSCQMLLSIQFNAFPTTLAARKYIILLFKIYLNLFYMIGILGGFINWLVTDTSVQPATMSCEIKSVLMSFLL